MDLGDPRLHGPADILYSSDCHDGGGCMYWGVQELIGPDGTWAGTFNGVETRGEGGGFTVDYQVLTGRGAYEGWTYVGQSVNRFDGPAQHFGVVYEGSPPPPSASD